MEVEATKKKDPDFIGIGDQKAATSWIFQCLAEHPDICGSSSKEVHFFDKDYNYRQGLDHYRSFFEHCRPGNIKGEFTPRYIFLPEVPERIYENYPNIKLIACLRNPVERTFSQYRYEVQQKGRLSIFGSFREALDKDQNLKERGFYHKLLTRYFDLFPRENILILVYEELKEAPLDNIQRIYSFLGVDANYEPDSLYQKKNVTGSRKVELKYPLLNNLIYRGRRMIKKNSYGDRFLDRAGLKKKLNKFVKNNKKVFPEDNKKDIPVLSDEDRQYLKETYREDIENLEKLIGRDLSLWK